MSPKLNLRYRQYRFCFFSNEESRPHIHVFVDNPRDNSKFWITKDGFLLAHNKARIPERDLGDIAKYLDANMEYVLASWARHFDL